jgi:hypothetical protein
MVFEARVSDISLGPGFAVMVGGAFTLILGGALLILSIVVGLVFARSTPWPLRVRRFSAGPLACLGFAVAYLLVAEFLDESSLWWLGEQYLVVPFVGLGVALLTTTAVEFARVRRKQKLEARTPQALAGTRAP